MRLSACSFMTHVTLSMLCNFFVALILRFYNGSHSELPALESCYKTQMR